MNKTFALLHIIFIVLLCFVYVAIPYSTFIGIPIYEDLLWDFAFIMIGIQDTFLSFMIWFIMDEVESN